MTQVLIMFFSAIVIVANESNSTVQVKNCMRSSAYNFSPSNHFPDVLISDVSPEIQEIL